MHPKSVTQNSLEYQQKGLMEIAERCPVHRTLVSEIQIRIRQKGSAASHQLS